MRSVWSARERAGVVVLVLAAGATLRRVVLDPHAAVGVGLPGGWPGTVDRVDSDFGQRKVSATVAGQAVDTPSFSASATTRTLPGGGVSMAAESMLTERVAFPPRNEPFTFRHALEASTAMGCAVAPRPP